MFLIEKGLHSVWPATKADLNKSCPFGAELVLSYAEQALRFCYGANSALLSYRFSYGYWVWRSQTLAVTRALLELPSVLYL